MKLSNIRYGFATNSSSTHSICFIDERDVVKEPSFDKENNFGWDFFTLNHKEDRLSYMLVTIYQGLVQHFGNVVANMIFKTMCTDIEQEQCLLLDVEHLISGCIDHQSQISIPKLHNNHVAIEYCYDLVKLGLMENIVIYGGNDNEEEPISIKAGSANEIDFPVEVGTTLLGRRDTVGDVPVWTLFNSAYGWKTRVVFDNNTKYVKSTYPELVDISITDYCESNCAYCYRGSTTKGTHASKRDIDNLLYVLYKWGVFEIAFGGGEPTSHPNFVEILKQCKACNIVANFTTRNLDWIRNMSWLSFKDDFGAFAYSIESAKHVYELSGTISSVNFPKNKCNVQLVMGVVTKEQFMEILNACYDTKLTLVLLGYKTTHRGANYTPKDYSWLVDAIKDNMKTGKFVRIGVDTVIAQQFSEQLKKAGIPGLLFNTEEGKFSCFIDAVSKTISASSFDEKQISYVNAKKWIDETLMHNAYLQF